MCIRDRAGKARFRHVLGSGGNGRHVAGERLFFDVLPVHLNALPVGKQDVYKRQGENKLRELMDSGELEYIQNGNRRLLADAAIGDWYERAKRKVAPQNRDVYKRQGFV